MDQLTLMTEGLPEAEDMLLSMILSFAADQLQCPCSVIKSGNPHAVLYDMSNPRSRMMWEQERGTTSPIAVAVSDAPVPGAQWVLRKPIRTHTLTAFLNGLSAYVMKTSLPLAPPSAESPLSDPYASLKTRLTSVAARRAINDGGFREIKLLFAGSVAAGKSTAIESISDVPTIRTDVAASDHVSKLKPLTTVAMDYGEMGLDDGRRLRLYGAPGQRRYDFMSKILCKGALGLVILLDNRIVNPLAELDYYSFVFSDLIESTAMVVGVTHRDQAPEPALQKYEDYFRVRQQPWPVFPVDPRKRSDVVTLVSALVSMLEQTRKPLVRR